MSSLFWRVLADERGQDLIEYALLSAFIGMAGVTVFNAFGGALLSAYTNWNDAMPAVAEMPPPVP